MASSVGGVRQKDTEMRLPRATQVKNKQPAPQQVQDIGFLQCLLCWVISVLLPNHSHNVKHQATTKLYVQPEMPFQLFSMLFILPTAWAHASGVQMSAATPYPELAT